MKRGRITDLWRYEKRAVQYIGSGREEVHLGRRAGETEGRKKMAGANIKADEGGGKNAHNENLRKKGQGRASIIVFPSSGGKEEETWDVRVIKGGHAKKGM